MRLNLSTNHRGREIYQRCENDGRTLTFDFYTARSRVLPCAFVGAAYICIITKTRLYNFNPLKPHFYIVKLGFTWVYIIFLISAQRHRLWVLVRTASSRRFLRVPTIYVLSRNVKNIRIFYLKIFIFWW